MTSKSNARPRRSRTYEEKLEIVQRALNRKQSGETIKKISEDTGTSEAIIYMLLDRYRNKIPLDLRESHQPPQNKADEEAQEMAELIHPRIARHQGVQKSSLSANIRVEHASPPENMSPETEIALLRQRVAYLEGIVRALTSVALGDGGFN